MMKKRKKGITVASVEPNSQAYNAGLREGDRIYEVNDVEIANELEFSFYAASDFVELKFFRDDIDEMIQFEREPGVGIGFEVEAAPVQECKNKCVFCFVDQMPKGMRKSLYIRDEDIRYSFLDGHYVTLTSVTDKEFDKIIEMNMSPLYISVHATDPDVRKQMLKNKNSGEIMNQLKELQDNGIDFHTQIVVCPGYNDGEVLEQTMADLVSFGDTVLSISVVPVGLTNHRKIYLKPVDKEIAQEICEIVTPYSDKEKARVGKRKVFIADEMYVKAEIPVPLENYYEGYPQLENGVGMIRTMVDNWESLKKDLTKVEKTKTVNKSLILASVSAEEYVKNIIAEMNEYIPHHDIVVEPVINQFFGDSVTVSGLNTGQDVVYMAETKGEGIDSFIVPKVMFNKDGLTIDGYTVEELIQKIDKDIIVVEHLHDIYNTLMNDEVLCQSA